MSAPAFVRSWPSLADLPQHYPDARNRSNRYPLLYRAGRCFPLRGALETAGRVPLLAVGSNAYPRQLSDKLADDPADLEGIPLVPTLLRGFDAAFCPRRSRKGYVPLSLAARPGAVSLSWLQWLTPRQLNLIAATEGPRYALVGGRDLASRIAIDPRWRAPAAVYAWWYDSLLLDGGSAVWLDVWRPARAQQLALDVDHAALCPNPIPTAWQIVPRDLASGRIAADAMPELC